MRKQLGADEWRRLVAEFEESEQKQKEFAAAKGVSVSTLQFWVYKLRREARRAAAPQFLPVEVVSSTALAARQTVAPGGGPCATPLEVALPSGRVLRFSEGTDVGYVRALLAALG
ncbi:IS66 family insertion sequence element accessory protein TnpA [Myxococcus vastator]|uniref:IS66 family insertion sequence element accessory protein TnpA n=1 Tax=Myxococcus vastator TaxID=2709664 RepID=UPI0013D3962E|nr:IS66 family insertion sequence element accessory protein TnpB [Myxococcus vastator]